MLPMIRLLETISLLQRFFVTFVELFSLNTVQWNRLQPVQARLKLHLTDIENWWSEKYSRSIELNSMNFNFQYQPWFMFLIKICLIASKFITFLQNKVFQIFARFHNNIWKSYEHFSNFYTSNHMNVKFSIVWLFCSTKLVHHNSGISTEIEYVGKKCVNLKLSCENFKINSFINEEIIFHWEKK